MPARREPDELGTAALAAARAVARAHGRPTDDLIVMSSGANLVVRLAPTPVIAKAAESSRVVRDAGAFLARELAVAAAARAAGLPAVAPADAVAAVVHEHEGVPVTFWEGVPPGRPGRPDPERLGELLAALHAGLAASALVLPRLAPLEDVPRFLARSASLRRSPWIDGAAAVRAYARASGRDDLDDEALAPWIALRELRLDVWLSLYAERGLPV
jgi:hypothetical protein